MFGSHPERNVVRRCVLVSYRPHVHDAGIPDLGPRFEKQLCYSVTQF